MAFETVNIGSSPKSATAGDRYTFSKVRLIDQKTGDVYESGNDTGRTFVYKAPVGASQQLADALANKLGGKMYTAFEASRASVDPAAEIGDCIEDSTGRLTGAMCTQTLNCGSGYSTCGAPGFEETEAEYPQKTEEDKAYEYTNNAIASYAGGDWGEGVSALRVEIVDELPEGHEKQNVLWVIKYAEKSSAIRSITVAGSGYLSPSFKSTTYYYTLGIRSGGIVTGLDIFAEDATTEITVSYSGASDLHGTGSMYAGINFRSGMTITVTGKNGDSQTSYTITVP